MCLTVLRFRQVPSWVPPQITGLLQLLLCKNAAQRLANATASSVDFNSDLAALRAISYDPLRSHAFFADWAGVHSAESAQLVVAAGSQLPSHLLLPSDEADAGSADALSTVQGAATVFLRPALSTAPAHERYLRNLGRACLELAEATAENGGTRPDVEWMQVQATCL